MIPPLLKKAKVLSLMNKSEFILIIPAVSLWLQRSPLKIEPVISSLDLDSAATHGTFLYVSFLRPLNESLTQNVSYSSVSWQPFRRSVPDLTKMMQYISSGLCVKNSCMHFSLPFFSKFRSTKKFWGSWSLFGPLSIILMLLIVQTLPSPTSTTMHGFSF